MSKENALQKYGVAGISDVLACFGVPTATALQIYSDVLQKRSSEALEILLSEIRQGHFKNIDQHEVVSIIARFQRDAMEGVARNNLRLMARIINGMAVKQELKAPTFLKYANILASLNEEEIIVLGIMARSKHGSVEGNSLPAVFNNKNILQPEIIQQALLRTGLVTMQINSKSQNNSFKTENELIYTLAPLMYEILKYTDFLTKEAA